MNTLIFNHSTRQNLSTAMAKQEEKDIWNKREIKNKREAKSSTESTLLIIAICMNQKREGKKSQKQLLLLLTAQGTATLRSQFL